METNATVKVEVPNTTISEAAGTETQGPWVTAFAALRVLMEPITAWRQKSLFGNAAGGRYHMTWETGEVVPDGARVTWNGKRYSFELGVDDVYRDPATTTIEPYRTGHAVEEFRKRDA